LPRRCFIKIMETTFNLITEYLDKLVAYGPIYIYLILIAASFIENIFPPFPGDFFTLAGGAMAAAGWLNIFLVFAVVYIGGIGSTIVVYYFGRKYGREFFIHRNYRFFSANDILKMEEWFDKRGALVLVISRFIVGARAAMALVGGMSRYNISKFTIFSSISFWLFNGILLFSSFLFVVNFDTISAYFAAYKKIAWPIILVAIALFVIVKIRNRLKNGKANKNV